MKIKLILFVALFTSVQLLAQNTIKSKQFGISFETNEQLDRYETESDSVLGYDNDNYAVDIEIFPLSNPPEKIYTDLQYGARTITEYMGFENIIDGGNIPNVKSAFYVTAEEKEGDTSILVYIIVMLNEELHIAYEISIYCYNLNSKEGKAIAKSFKLLN